MGQNTNKQTKTNCNHITQRPKGVFLQIWVFFKPAKDLHSHQLFTGVQFEEARDELRQGLYRTPPFHSPFLLLHDGGIAHSLQQQIDFENAEITKLMQSDIRLEKLLRGVSELI